MARISATVSLEFRQEALSIRWEINGSKLLGEALAALLTRHRAIDDKASC